jgi:hypothetical protein
MDMGMKMDELTECMDARHHARTDVAPIQHCAGDLQDRLPGETRKLTQQPTVIAAEDSQALGDREDELAVGHGFADVTGDVVGDHERPLLVAAGAQAPGAPDAGEALVQVAAGEELVDGSFDGGSPEAVALLGAVVVDAPELVEVPLEQLPQG